jgi:hypothetical protein
VVLVNLPGVSLCPLTITKQLQHFMPVILESGAALLGEGEHRMGTLVLDLLLHLDVAGFFELAHMGRQVAIRLPGAAEKEDEICTLDHGEVGQDL